MRSFLPQLVLVAIAFLMATAQTYANTSLLPSICVVDGGANRSLSPPSSNAAACTFEVGDWPTANLLLFGSNNNSSSNGPVAGKPLPTVAAVAPPTPGRNGAAAPPLYHEAGIWLAGSTGSRQVLFTSDRLGAVPDQTVTLSLVDASGALPPKMLPPLSRWVFLLLFVVVVFVCFCGAH